MGFEAIGLVSARHSRPAHTRASGLHSGHRVECLRNWLIRSGDAARATARIRHGRKRILRTWSARHPLNGASAIARTAAGPIVRRKHIRRRHVCRRPLQHGRRLQQRSGIEDVAGSRKLAIRAWWHPHRRHWPRRHAEHAAEIQTRTATQPGRHLVGIEVRCDCRRHACFLICWTPRSCASVGSLMKASIMRRETGSEHAIS